MLRYLVLPVLLLLPTRADEPASGMGGGSPPIDYLHNHNHHSANTAHASASQLTSPVVTLNESGEPPRIVNVEYIFDPAVVQLRGYAQVERVLAAGMEMAAYFRPHNLIINPVAVHFPDSVPLAGGNAPAIVNDMRLARLSGGLDIDDQSLALLITALPIASQAGSHNGFASISGLCSADSNAVISDRVIPLGVGGPLFPPNSPLDFLYLSEIMAHESGHVLGGLHNCGNGTIMAPFFTFVARTTFNACSAAQFEMLINASGGCVHEYLDITAGFSGTWYDLTHDGEGLQIQVLDDQRVLVAWYTYDETGRQRWLSGIGLIEGNRIVVDTLMTASGARFGDDFNPDDVVRETWGSAVITFNNCRDGLLTYRQDATGTPGVQTLSRLTTLDTLPCEQQVLPNEQDGMNVSGTWFDPAHDGEGLVIEQLSTEQMVFSWFSYDENGDQAWFTGVAQRQSDGSFLATQVNITAGGLFGPQFDPAQVLRMSWGNLRLSFTACDSALLEYASALPGYGNGSQNLARLTTPDGVVCVSQPVL